MATRRSKAAPEPQDGGTATDSPAGATPARTPMRVETRPLDSLIPYARNARTHSDAQVAQIAASLHEFGWMTPVLIDETGTIIAGHGRVLAALKLRDACSTIHNWSDLAVAPVVMHSHLTEAQRRAYVIADNKLALNAAWDAELLASELEGLKELGFDTGLVGFTADEFQTLAEGWSPDIDRVRRELESEDRATIRVCCRLEDEQQVRELIEVAIAGSVVADVELK